MKKMQKLLENLSVSREKYEGDICSIATLVCEMIGAEPGFILAEDFPGDGISVSCNCEECEESDNGCHYKIYTGSEDAFVGIDTMMDIYNKNGKIVRNDICENGSL